MSVHYEANYIRIKSKTIHPFKARCAYVGILASVLFTIFVIKEAVIYGAGVEMVCVLPIIILGLLLYWLLYKNNDSIFIDKENVKFHIASMSDSSGGSSINLKSLSRIHLSDEKCLLFYDSTGDQDYVFDVSYFARDDIQIALNLFSKAVKITIDDDIAKKEKFVVKVHDISTVRHRSIASITSNEPISSGRRRVIANETIKRNLEIADNGNKNSTKEIKRKLEL